MTNANYDSANAIMQEIAFLNNRIALLNKAAEWLSGSMIDRYALEIKPEAFQPLLQSEIDLLTEKRKYLHRKFELL